MYGQTDQSTSFFILTGMCKRSLIFSPSLNYFLVIYEFKQLNHILHPTINLLPKPAV